MSTRRLWLLAPILLVASCADLPSLDRSFTAPEEALAPEVHLDGVVAESATGFSFGPPLSDWRPGAQSTDLGIYPVVLICTSGQTACSPATASAWATRSAASSAVDVLSAPAHGEYLETEWRTSAAVPGAYRAVVQVVGVEMGRVEFNLRAPGAPPVGPGPSFVRGSAIPLVFTVPAIALSSAFGCSPGTGSVIDCDVVQVLVGQGSQARVFDTQGSLAGQVTIPSGAASEDHVLVLEHQAVAPTGPPLLPVADQYPYHLDVRTVSVSGAPVGYGGPGAGVVLCQDPVVDHTLTPLQQDQLEVLRVNGGVLQRLPTNAGAPECALTQPAPTPTQSFGARLSGARDNRWPTFAARLLSWVAPQPLVALHGGLNTSTGGFSGFTAVLGPDAASSTVMAVPGGVGGPTNIVVQARTGLGQPFRLGGDQVEFRVRGANPGTFMATDGGVGSYRGSYTATVAGTDTLEAFLEGVPIGSGPLILVQAPSGPVTHTLLVIVKDDADQPVAGARVVLEGATRYEITSDGKGFARFDDLESGPWTALVRSVPAGLGAAQPKSQRVIFGAEASEAREVRFTAPLLR